MELSLALIGGKRDVFTFLVSQAGDEIKEHVVVHHIYTDVDPTYIVAISAIDGSVYRIHGFTDSLPEFNKLLKAQSFKIAEPEQAEFVAALYRQVNPENRSMAAISSLLDLKQAAERQCQATPFDANETNFGAWWKRKNACCQREKSSRQSLVAKDIGPKKRTSLHGRTLCGQSLY